jgi:hypothetical protein
MQGQKPVAANTEIGRPVAVEMKAEILRKADVVREGVSGIRRDGSAIGRGDGVAGKSEEGGECEAAIDDDALGQEEGAGGNGGGSLVVDLKQPDGAKFSSRGLAGDFTRIRGIGVLVKANLR